MKHKEVEEIVAKWLESQHSPPKMIGTTFMPDFLVYTERQSEGNKMFITDIYRSNARRQMTI